MKLVRWVAWIWIVLSSLFMLIVTGAELVSARTATICVLVWGPFTIVWMMGAYTTALYTERPDWIRPGDYRPSTDSRFRCQACSSRYDVTTYSLPAECECLGMTLKLPRLWYCCTGCKEIYIVRHTSGKSDLIPLKELGIDFLGRPGQESIEIAEEKFRRVLDVRKRA